MENGRRYIIYFNSYWNGYKNISMSTSRILKVKQYLSHVNSNEVKISDDIFKQDDNVVIKYFVLQPRN